MKRGFTAVLAGAVLALSVTALADVTVTQIGGLENAAWIDGSNLLKMGEYGNYYVMDTQGNELTGSGYGSLEYDHGYIVARSNAEEVKH